MANKHGEQSPPTGRPIQAMENHLLLPRLMFAFGLALSSVCAVADDLKESQLEQEIRELQRQVQQQSRRIDTLERELAQSRVNLPRLNDRQSSKGSGASGDWLTLTNWDRIKLGMSEIDVMQVLGPPSTVRKSTNGVQRTLWYALELGAGSFLSGSVAVNDRKVVDVQKPSLK